MAKSNILSCARATGIVISHGKVVKHLLLHYRWLFTFLRLNILFGVLPFQRSTVFYGFWVELSSIPL